MKRSMIRGISPSSRQLILEAAKSLILQKGYEGFSMRQLSLESGFAKGTIYHYFRDKQEIYLNILEADLDEVRIQIRQAAIEGTVRERLARVVATYLDLVGSRHHALFRLLREGNSMEEKLRSLIKRHRDELLHSFGSLLKEGVELGEFRDVEPQLAVTGLLGMLNGQIADQLLSGDEGDPIVFTPSDSRALLDLFLKGINAPTDSQGASSQIENRQVITTDS